MGANDALRMEEMSKRDTKLPPAASRQEFARHLRGDGGLLGRFGSHCATTILQLLTLPPIPAVNRRVRY